MAHSASPNRNQGESMKELRQELDRNLDKIEMLAYHNGFEGALNGIDELSNQLHNQGDHNGAEALRWAAKELRGENA